MTRTMRAALLTCLGCWVATGVFLLVQSIAAMPQE